MKKCMAFALVLALVLLGTYAQAQAPTPSPEHMKLGFWIGTWKIEAEAKVIKFRWTVKDESPGLITWTSEISIDGGPWMLGGEAKVIRE